MTAIDPFAHDDAAYVLGALDDEERFEFEAHLLACPDCRARVDEVRATADLLAALPRSAGESPLPVEPVPDTVLPRLLRAAAAERGRRRRWTAGLGAVAAACVIALGVVAWPGGGSSAPSGPAPQAMAALQSVPLKATAKVISHGWGTEIALHCTYPAWDDENIAYGLVVVDKQNERHAAGDWTLVQGKDGVDFTSGTAVQTDDIAKLQIVGPTGTALLELDL